MAAHSIIIKTTEGSPLRKELVAAAAITPGHLVAHDGSGGIIKHGSANGAAQPVMFALENDLVGEDLDDAYASGETVQVGVFSPGDEVNALLAYGENVAKGALLTSAGDGTLHAAAGSDEGRLVGRAAEAKSNLTGGLPVRVRVEVI